MDEIHWGALLQSPVVIITALVLGTLGEVSKRTISAKAGDKGWRGVYYVTLPAHAVILGGLIGLIPWLPVPDELTKPGYEFAGRLGTGVLSGVVCKVGYDLIISTIRRMLSQGRGATASGSNPPPAP